MNKINVNQILTVGRFAGHINPKLESKHEADENDEDEFNFYRLTGDMNPTMHEVIRIWESMRYVTKTEYENK